MGEGPSIAQMKAIRCMFVCGALVWGSKGVSYTPQDISLDWKAGFLGLGPSMLLPKQMSGGKYLIYIRTESYN